MRPKKRQVGNNTDTAYDQTNGPDINTVSKIKK